jgi:hypothetical protein
LSSAEAKHLSPELFAGSGQPAFHGALAATEHCGYCIIVHTVHLSEHQDFAVLWRKQGYGALNQQLDLMPPC